MVTRSGRYFDTPFKGHRWVTQGDPLYPMIFNVVVGEAIKNRLSGVEEE